MTSIRSRPTVENAATAAEAVRALIHLTLGRGALGEPAELDRLVAELAIMAGRLPQLLRQLRGWLDTEQHAGRLRSDDTTDPARIVDRAAAQADRGRSRRARPGPRTRRRTPTPGPPGRHRTRPHPRTRAVKRDGDDAHLKVPRPAY